MNKRITLEQYAKENYHLIATHRSLEGCVWNIHAFNGIKPLPPEIIEQALEFAKGLSLPHDDVKRECWWPHNPDYGDWDAWTVVRYDYKKEKGLTNYEAKKLDLYICAILIRPFTKNTQEEYEDLKTFPIRSRLELKWDSREKKEFSMEMFNKDWNIDPTGNLEHAKRGYFIESARLTEEDWLLHLSTSKAWFDANTFLPAYFEACKRANKKHVTIKTYY